MKEYKYHLDKTSKKFNCPQCGKKRFVKYIETETGHYADNQYGRCDRETTCGYSKYPNNSSIINYKYTNPKPVSPSFIEKEVMLKTLKKYETNPLITYLYNNYNVTDVDIIIDKYLVGTSKQFNNSTVFWQMDNTGNIRSGKIMAYDTSTGKRKKNNEGTPLINWVHSALKIPNYNLKQCLFGLHLLKDNLKQVAIVESEKTALIMSIEFPNYTWMSTGSLQGFKYEYLAPLKGKTIIAFPDKGGYNEWKNTADSLKIKGFHIEVSQFLENKEYENGWDLVDVLSYENKN